ncbi:glycosyltransferase family 2 protein [Ornithinimicrobium pekingense]|uniref:Glycosyl transferase n=1 Tax=Ornithinimicrobium pekingense TaxID=384677 RepID=A0ABQ2F8A6_9MICO|nr:glycosyltransferase family 2 protein [Ornithinimicrobium pekingense]GGK71248.1 glycosyl transferase [Ornithinimicrobium pekingense]
MHSQPDVSLIVVSYRSAELVTRLVRSIDAAADGLSWRATVVDNWPGGDDLSELETLDERVTVVRTGENLGYSGGLNAGVASGSRGRFTVFLNPDLVLRPRSLHALVTELAGGSAAAVPLMVDEGGRRQDSLRREPTLLTTLGETIFGNGWAGRPQLLSEVVRDPAQYRRRHPVHWATGAALAVRTEVVDTVGPWDAERFFLYSEETDFARRIREGGGQVIFVPEAVVVHREGGSGSTPQLDALLQVNKLRYYRKWHGPVSSGLFLALLTARNVARPHRPGARAAVKALVSRRARAALPGGAR